MPALVRLTLGSLVRWWIEHNPLYLLSAALVALGVRSLIVNPDARAGESGLMLTTLGVLLAYKWAVDGVLLLLHHKQRATEDSASLLLVATVFWTGPLAAAIELTARNARLGQFVMIGVAAAALVELEVIRRRLHLSFSGTGRALAIGCILLLVGAASGLRVRDESGTNELLLYALWWLLALIAALAAASGGSIAEREPNRARGLEAGFLLLTFTATATQLIGANYAFLGHARAFYAAPLILATTAIAFQLLGRLRIRSGLIWAVGGAMPVLAVVLSNDRFDPSVPTIGWPIWLRDPRIVILALAGLVWWLGAWRSGHSFLLHTGSAAFAAAGGFAALGLSAGHTAPGIFGNHAMESMTHSAIATILFSIAIYLAICAIVRRSRTEAVVALLVLQPAVWVAMWDGTAAGRLIVALTAGWTVFVGLHLHRDRPHWPAFLVPVVLLIVTDIFFDFDSATQSAARWHAACVIVVLAGMAWLWQGWTYRTLALTAGASEGLFLAARLGSSGAHPVASLAIGAGFVILAGGLLVSWFKPRLLAAAITSQLEDGNRRDECGD